MDSNRQCGEGNINRSPSNNFNLKCTYENAFCSINFLVHPTQTTHKNTRFHSDVNDVSNWFFVQLQKGFDWSGFVCCLFCYTFVMISGVFKSLPPTKRIPHAVCGPSRLRSIKNSRVFEVIVFSHCLHSLLIFFNWFLFLCRSFRLLLCWPRSCKQKCNNTLHTRFVLRSQWPPPNFNRCTHNSHVEQIQMTQTKRFTFWRFLSFGGDRFCTSFEKS